MDEGPLLILLLFLSGFFSGAEIAIFSLSAEKIQAIKNKTHSDKILRKIQRLELLRSDPEKLLVTILIGNNIVNIASASIATIMATNFAEKNGFRDNETLVIGVVTGIMTFLILLFGEIMPKSIAHKYSLKFSLFIAPILSVLQFILAPLVLPLAILTKKFSGKKKVKHGLNEDELKAALELSEKDGKIDEMEKEWTEKILELDEHSVESVMTPRSKIFALEDDTSTSVAITAFQKHSFSRIPIYHDDLDNIIGLLTVHVVLEKLTEKGFDKLKVANLPLRTPIKIPITMRIGTLFKEFQSAKTHMGIVYDEFGGLVGLITMEDVLEEIFGEIQDEEDEDTQSIRQIGKTKFSFSGETELEAIETFIKNKSKISISHYPWTLEDENKTVSLFILENLEKFPEKNEKIELKIRRKKFIFKVKKIESEQIMEVELIIE